MLSAVVDRSAHAVVVFDSAGRPVVVNERASNALSADDGLALVNDGFRTPDPQTQAQLNQALRGATLQMALGRQLSAPGPVVVPRMPGRQPYRVLFSPLSLRDDRTGLPPSSAVLAVIHQERRGDGQNLLPARLRSTFGLGRAEIRLCAALLAGQSLPEAANELNISRNTAKTHLARVFDKTGVHSQAALLRLIVLGARGNPANH